MRGKKNKTEQERIVLDMRSYDKKNSGSPEDASDDVKVSLAIKLEDAINCQDDPSISQDEQNDNGLLSSPMSTLERKADANYIDEIDSSIVFRDAARGGKWNLFLSRIKGVTKAMLNKAKGGAHYVFIDGMSGMALGLFATLIIGTIIAQIGKYVGDNFVGAFLSQVGNAAKIMMGAGIGVGMSCKFKKPPLLAVSSGVSGTIGAHAITMLDIINKEAGALDSFVISAVGEPVGAFVAAMVAILVGSLVHGKTKVDIIITPLVAIVAGSVAGLVVGPPVSSAMAAIGSAIEWATQQNRFVMGIVVAVLMGMALTAPISSAALGIGLKLSGVAAGAAAVGCCCNMVGFAVSSFRENRWGGLLAQGVGTSMLQMPNIVKRPIIWLPAIIASAILGPISSAVLGMTNNAIGSGMGSAGLVGSLMGYEAMVESGVSSFSALLQIGLMHFILPAAICLTLSELMRRAGWIRPNDMRLSM